MREHLLKEHVLSRPFDGEHVAVLRRLVAKCADDAGLPKPRQEDFVLAVDEILTNAIRHGGGSGQLDLWISDGMLWFRVSDSGPGMASPLVATPPSPTVLGGRGLWIAGQVTDELTISTGTDGTVVTAAVALAS